MKHVPNLDMLKGWKIKSNMVKNTQKIWGENKKIIDTNIV